MKNWQTCNWIQDNLPKRSWHREENGPFVFLSNLREPEEKAGLQGSDLAGTSVRKGHKAKSFHSIIFSLGFHSNGSSSRSKLTQWKQTLNCLWASVSMCIDHHHHHPGGMGATRLVQCLAAARWGHVTNVITYWLVPAHRQVIAS